MDIKSNHDQSQMIKISKNLDHKEMQNALVVFRKKLKSYYHQINPKLQKIGSKIIKLKKFQIKKKNIFF